MADKISTVILKVDLGCRRCYKKISKAICHVQEKVNIQEIVFNEKTNTVTISGPFDAEKVCQKLCCKAYSVIKEIEIKGVKEKPKEAPKPEKAKDDAKPAKPAEPAKDKPKEAKPAEPTKDKPKEAKPAEPTKDKPKEAKSDESKKDKPKNGDKPKEAKPAEPAEVKNDKPKEVKFAEPEGGNEKPKALEWVRSEPMYFDQPVQGYEPVWARPACGCQGYYGSSMCCSCAGGGYGGAGGYGWGQPGPSQVVYGKPVYDGYNGGSHNYFCEEDPQSCSIM